MRSSLLAGVLALVLASPTPAPSEAPVSVPANLDQALVALEHAIPPADQARIRAGTEEDLFRLHHGFAAWLRNEWGLYGDSPLATWFHKRGIDHADDMSMIVLRAYWRRANGKPIDLEGQIAHTKGWWERARAAHPAEVLAGREAAMQLASRMAGWTPHWRPTPYVVFPEAEASHPGVRDFFPWATGTIVTTRVGNEPRVAVWLVERDGAQLRPVTVPELARIDAVAPVGDSLVLAGIDRSGDGLLLQLDAKARHTIVPPPGKGPVQVVAGSRVRIVRDSRLYERQRESWEPVGTPARAWPFGWRAPQMTGSRLWLAAEVGDVSSWQWVDPRGEAIPRAILSTTGIERFVRDTSMHDALVQGDSLWLTVGGELEGTSLIRFDADDYRVAIFRGATTLETPDPETIPSEAERAAASTVHVTAIATGDAGLVLAGATGLWLARGKQIEPVVSFRGLGGRRLERLRVLGDGRYLLGAGNGGVFALRRNAPDDWVLRPVRAAEPLRL